MKSELLAKDFFKARRTAYLKTFRGRLSPLVVTNFQVILNVLNKTKPFICIYNFLALVTFTIVRGNGPNSLEAAWIPNPRSRSLCHELHLFNISRLGAYLPLHRKRLKCYNNNDSNKKRLLKRKSCSSGFVCFPVQ